MTVGVLFVQQSLHYAEISLVPSERFKARRESVFTSSLLDLQVPSFLCYAPPEAEENEALWPRGAGAVTRGRGKAAEPERLEEGQGNQRCTGAQEMAAVQLVFYIRFKAGIYLLRNSLL